MALAALLKTLREQAAERRAAVLADAVSQATRIGEESARALDRRRREFLSEARRQEEEAAHRAVARAEAEAAGAVLLARDRLLARVRSVLERRIATATDDPGFGARLPGEIEAALRRLRAGPVVVRVPPGLAPRAAEALAGRADVLLETAPGMGAGFSALESDGAAEIDGTLEARLEHAWPALAVAVLAELSR
jgi:vacuolar-type H+-ATPase subunit E/Vma4